MSWRAVIHRFEPALIARVLRRLERTSQARATLISETKTPAGSFQASRITIALQGLAVVPPILIDPDLAAWALWCEDGERCTILKVERANEDGILEFTVLDESPRLSRLVLVFKGQMFSWPIIVPSVPSAR